MAQDGVFLDPDGLLERFDTNPTPTSPAPTPPESPAETAGPEAPGPEANETEAAEPGPLVDPDSYRGEPEQPLFSFDAPRE